MHKLLPILLTLALLITAACESKSDLLEGEWELATLNGVNALPDVTVTLSIHGDTVSGFSGCNTYSGAATIQARQIQFSDLSMTLIACLDEQVTQQEADFLSALSMVDTWQVSDDRLTLSGGNWTVEFTRVIP
jgi:heat shock protein HslJ